MLYKRPIVLSVFLGAILFVLFVLYNKNSKLLVEKDVTTNIYSFEKYEGRHKREDCYPVDFHTICIEGDNYTLQIEKRIYNDDFASELIESINDDVKQILINCPLNFNKTNIYIVPENKQNLVICGEDGIFCTCNDIIDRTYLPALVAKSFNIHEKWKQYGISELLFSNASNVNIASANLDDVYIYYTCSDLLFSEFATAEEIIYLRLIAGKIVRYIVSEYGWEELYIVHYPLEIMDEWTRYYGIDYGAILDSLPKGYNLLSDVIIIDQGMTITVENENFVIRCSDVDWIGSSREFFVVICNILNGCTEIIDRCDMNLVHDSNTQEKFVFELVNKQRSSAVPIRNTVYLARSEHAYHELVHLLFRNPYDRGEAEWIFEGIAMYVSLPVESIMGINEFAAYFQDDLFQLYYNISKEETEFRNIAKTIYQHSIEEGMDERFAIYKAFGTASTFLDVERSQISIPLVHYTIAEANNISMKNQGDVYGYGAGNNLSYAEAFSFFCFLVDKYGLDYIISGVTNKEDIKVLFDISYNEIYDEYVNLVREEYDYLK